MTPIEPAHGLPKRVLIVEDSSLARLYYRNVLEGAGYHVDQAMNGLEGIEKALAEPFDLLIVDVNMPKMDGFSFLQLLRKRLRRSHAARACHHHRSRKRGPASGQNRRRKLLSCKACL